jgi:hypothetical protein
MHNREKYPAIWVEKEAAESELNKLMAERKTHTDAIAEVQLKLDEATNALKAEKERLNNLAMKDFDRIAELRGTVARCAIAMGAVTVSRGK